MAIKNGQTPNADEVIESIGRLTTRIAYNGVNIDSSNWENTDYLTADTFTDSNGSKNTVDTGNTTALLVTDRFELNFTDEASGDTTHDPNSVNNPSYFFDGNDSTYADKTWTASGGFDVSCVLGKTFSSSRDISTVKIKVSASAGGNSSNSSSVSLVLQKYDGYPTLSTPVLAKPDYKKIKNQVAEPTFLH